MAVTTRSLFLFAEYQLLGAPIKREAGIAPPAPDKAEGWWDECLKPCHARNLCDQSKTCAIRLYEARAALSGCSAA